MKQEKLMGNGLIERGPTIEAMLKTECDTIRSQSLTEQLKQRQARAQSEYDEVTALLDKLEENPEAAELFDAISRLGGLRY